MGLGTGALRLLLSRQVESVDRTPAFDALKRPQTVRLLAGLAGLFALDAFAGGFGANAVIIYWLHVRFGAGPQLLGPVFAAVAFLQAMSYEISGRLSVRIGLINTMVFTHLPSNLLLLSVAFSPSLGWAIALLLARFLLSQMDVPSRQAYVVSIVPPADLAAAVALTGALRGVAQPFGSPLAGVAIGAAAYWIPFVAGGGAQNLYQPGFFPPLHPARAQDEPLWFKPCPRMACGES